MLYVIVSFNYVSVCDTTTDLYGGLYYWPEEYCEVFSVETMEEANVLARQVYAALFYSHPAHFGTMPMSLPASGCYSVQAEGKLRMSNPESGFLPQETKVYPLLLIGKADTDTNSVEQPCARMCLPLRYGAWSIVWCQGYGVAIGLEALVNKITEKTYAHGKWYPNSARASFFAQAEYAHRLSHTCDLRHGHFNMPNVPVKPGQQYDSQKNDFDSSVLRTLRDSGLL